MMTRLDAIATDVCFPTTAPRRQKRRVPVHNFSGSWSCSASSPIVHLGPHSLRLSVVHRCPCIVVLNNSSVHASHSVSSEYLAGTHSPSAGPKCTCTPQHFVSSNLAIHVLKHRCTVGLQGEEAIWTALPEKGVLDRQRAHIGCDLVRSSTLL
jgi:hypothetical protein